MVTGHIDGCVRIWDLRTYKKMVNGREFFEKIVFLNLKFICFFLFELLKKMKSIHIDYQEE